MKLLLYCTKGKPYLVKSHKGFCLTTYKHPVNAKERYDAYFILSKEYNKDALNGTIPCECDYEVEDIFAGQLRPSGEWLLEDTRPDILKEACLEQFDLEQYLGNQMGYAIHIKNLHIFDKPKELNEYYNRVPMMYGDMRSITSAPQNMRYVEDYFGHKYVLISIHPEWLCKILNGEKTIEVRKKVLKEME